MMDFSPQIINALQEKLDISEAYPIVLTMNPQTIELFVGSVFTKLNNKICEIMKDTGEKYVEENDPFGLSLLLIRNGVKLPTDMLQEITHSIIKNSRRSCKWIAPQRDCDSGVWYCKLYLDPYSKESNEEKE